MDALSEAMRAVRVTSALFFNGELTAPWRFATPAQDVVAATVSPQSERLVLFHLVTHGNATARAEGHDDVALTAGDIVVFPHGDAHEMWNGRTSKLFPGARLLPKLAKGELAAEKWGGNGPATRIICGYLGCERHAESLFLSGLPAILKVNVRSRPAGAWIESAIRHCASEDESQRPGRLAVLSKLAETLFVETLCQYMDELPPERTGWLATARDPKVGQALAHLHRSPARAWTLPDLARESGTSRTVARRSIRSTHGRVAARVPRTLAASARGAPLDDHGQESPAGRLRRWVRVGSGVQPCFQARVRSATGAIPTGA